MADILHRFSIDAPPERVQELVATPAGIERWWTGQTVDADAGTLRFSFGGPEATAVEITEETPEQVVWRVVEGPPDWIGTDITFTFRPTGEGTTLLFSHAGWRETGEFMANCSSEWASYLIGLKAGAEGPRRSRAASRARAPIQAWRAASGGRRARRRGPCR